MNTQATPTLKQTDKVTSTLPAPLHALMTTGNHWSPLAVRVFLGGVMLPHGMQKLLGSFGGYGFEGTMGFFTQQLGMPWLLGFLVIMLEFFGSIMLITGLATRFVAASFIAVMAGAVAMVAGTNGFFMNWSGQQAGEGYEFHLLMIGMAASLLISGAGRASIDRKLTQD